MNRIKQLKKLIRDNKAFNKEYKAEIKQLESEMVLEVGCWYKLTSDYGSLKKDMVFIVEKNQDYEGSKYPYWVVNHNMFLDTKDTERNYSAPHQDQLTPATNKEVETALIAEAKKRGFKEGVKYNNFIANESFRYCGGFIFNKCENTLTDKDRNTIFKKGRWATIIKDKTITLQSGGYTEAQLKDVLLTFNNK